jgi:hypothetical protein
MRILSADGVPGFLCIAAVAAVCASPAARSDPPAAAAAAAAEGEAAVSAVWKPRELRFVFMGFTAHYSCDGLQDKMRRTLLMLGARPDLSVNEYGCAGGLDRPSPFPSVHIKVNVLQAAAAAGEAAAGAPPAPTVSAHWKLVDFTARRDPLDVAGDCELIEQIKQRILPLFTTRNVQYESTCIPNQYVVGGTHLKAEVLVADKADTGKP